MSRKVAGADETVRLPPCKTHFSRLACRWDDGHHPYDLEPFGGSLGRNISFPSGSTTDQFSYMTAAMQKSLAQSFTKSTSGPSRRGTGTEADIAGFLPETTQTSAIGPGCREAIATGPVDIVTKVLETSGIFGANGPNYESELEKHLAKTEGITISAGEVPHMVLPQNQTVCVTVRTLGAIAAGEVATSIRKLMDTAKMSGKYFRMSDLVGREITDQAQYSEAAKELSSVCFQKALSQDQEALGKRIEEYVQNMSSDAPANKLSLDACIYIASKLHTMVWVSIESQGGETGQKHPSSAHGSAQKKTINITTPIRLDGLTTIDLLGLGSAPSTPMRIVFEGIPLNMNLMTLHFQVYLGEQMKYEYSQEFCIVATSNGRYFSKMLRSTIQKPVVEFRSFFSDEEGDAEGRATTDGLVLGPLTNSNAMGPQEGVSTSDEQDGETLEVRMTNSGEMLLPDDVMKVIRLVIGFRDEMDLKKQNADILSDESLSKAPASEHEKAFPIFTVSVLPQLNTFVPYNEFSAVERVRGLSHRDQSANSEVVDRVGDGYGLGLDQKNQFYLPRNSVIHRPIVPTASGILRSTFPDSLLYPDSLASREQTVLRSSTPLVVELEVNELLLRMAFASVLNVDIWSNTLNYSIWASLVTPMGFVIPVRAYIDGAFVATSSPFQLIHVCDLALSEAQKSVRDAIESNLRDFRERSPYLIEPKYLKKLISNSSQSISIKMEVDASVASLFDPRTQPPHVVFVVTSNTMHDPNRAPVVKDSFSLSDIVDSFGNAGITTLQNAVTSTVERQSEHVPLTLECHDEQFVEALKTPNDTDSYLGLNITRIAGDASCSMASVAQSPEEDTQSVQLVVDHGKVITLESIQSVVEKVFTKSRVESWGFISTVSRLGVARSSFRDYHAACPSLDVDSEEIDKVVGSFYAVQMYRQNSLPPAVFSATTSGPEAAFGTPLAQAIFTDTDYVSDVIATKYQREAMEKYQRTVPLSLTSPSCVPIYIKQCESMRPSVLAQQSPQGSSVSALVLPLLRFDVVSPLLLHDSLLADIVCPPSIVGGGAVYGEGAFLLDVFSSLESVATKIANATMQVLGRITSAAPFSNNPEAATRVLEALGSSLVVSIITSWNDILRVISALYVSFVSTDGDVAKKNIAQLVSITSMLLCTFIPGSFASETSSSVITELLQSGGHHFAPEALALVSLVQSMRTHLLASLNILTPDIVDEVLCLWSQNIDGMQLIPGATPDTQKAQKVHIAWSVVNIVPYMLTSTSQSQNNLVKQIYDGLFKLSLSLANTDAFMPALVLLVNTLRSNSICGCILQKFPPVPVDQRVATQLLDRLYELLRKLVLDHNSITQEERVLMSSNDAFICNSSYIASALLFGVADIPSVLRTRGLRIAIGALFAELSTGNVFIHPEVLALIARLRGLCCALPSEDTRNGVRDTLALASLFYTAASIRSLREHNQFANFLTAHPVTVASTARSVTIFPAELPLFKMQDDLQRQVAALVVAGLCNTTLNSQYLRNNDDGRAVATDLLLYSSICGKLVDKIPSNSPLVLTIIELLLFNSISAGSIVHCSSPLTYLRHLQSRQQQSDVYDETGGISGADFMKSFRLHLKTLAAIEHARQQVIDVLQKILQPYATKSFISPIQACRLIQLLLHALYSSIEAWNKTNWGIDYSPNTQALFQCLASVICATVITQYKNGEPLSTETQSRMGARYLPPGVGAVATATLADAALSGAKQQFSMLPDHIKSELFAFALTPLYSVAGHSKVDQNRMSSDISVVSSVADSLLHHLTKMTEHIEKLCKEFASENSDSILCPFLTVYTVSRMRQAAQLILHASGLVRSIALPHQRDQKDKESRDKGKLIEKEQNEQIENLLTELASECVAPGSQVYFPIERALASIVKQGCDNSDRKSPLAGFALTLLRRALDFRNTFPGGMKSLSLSALKLDQGKVEDLTRRCQRPVSDAEVMLINAHFAYLAQKTSGIDAVMLGYLKDIEAGKLLQGDIASPKRGRKTLRPTDSEHSEPLKDSNVLPEALRPSCVVLVSDKCNNTVLQWASRTLPPLEDIRDFACLAAECKDPRAHAVLDILIQIYAYNKQLPSASSALLSKSELLRSGVYDFQTVGIALNANPVQVSYLAARLGVLPRGGLRGGIQLTSDCPYLPVRPFTTSVDDIVSMLIAIHGADPSSCGSLPTRSDALTELRVGSMNEVTEASVAIFSEVYASACLEQAAILSRRCGDFQVAAQILCNLGSLQTTIGLVKGKPQQYKQLYLDQERNILAHNMDSGNDSGTELWLRELMPDRGQSLLPALVRVDEARTSVLARVEQDHFMSLPELCHYWALHFVGNGLPPSLYGRTLILRNHPHESFEQVRLRIKEIVMAAFDTPIDEDKLVVYTPNMDVPHIPSSISVKVSSAWLASSADVVDWDAFKATVSSVDKDKRLRGKMMPKEELACLKSAIETAAGITERNKNPASFDLQCSAAEAVIRSSVLPGFSARDRVLSDPRADSVQKARQQQNTITDTAALSNSRSLCSPLVLVSYEPHHIAEKVAPATGEASGLEEWGTRDRATGAFVIKQRFAASSEIISDPEPTLVRVTYLLSRSPSLEYQAPVLIAHSSHTAPQAQIQYITAQLRFIDAYKSAVQSTGQSKPRTGTSAMTSILGSEAVVRGFPLGLREPLTVQLITEGKTPGFVYHNIGDAVSSLLPQFFSCFSETTLDEASACGITRAFTSLQKNDVRDAAILNYRILEERREYFAKQRKAKEEGKEEEFKRNVKDPKGMTAAELCVPDESDDWRALRVFLGEFRSASMRAQIIPGPAFMEYMMKLAKDQFTIPDDHAKIDTECKKIDGHIEKIVSAGTKR